MERGIGGNLVGVVLRLPEPSTVAPDVPVRELLDDEGFEGPCRAVGGVAVERLSDLSDQLVEPRNDPAVEQGPLLQRRSGVQGGEVEAVEPGVVGKEA
jgi:hypothetical protein